jgi:hypothetical protein
VHSYSFPDLRNFFRGGAVELTDENVNKRHEEDDWVKGVSGLVEKKALRRMPSDSFYDINAGELLLHNT